MTAGSRARSASEIRFPYRVRTGPSGMLDSPWRAPLLAMHSAVQPAFALWQIQGSIAGTPLGAHASAVGERAALRSYRRHPLQHTSALHEDLQHEDADRDSSVGGLVHTPNEINFLAFPASRPLSALYRLPRSGTCECIGSCYCCRCCWLQRAPARPLERGAVARGDRRRRVSVGRLTAGPHPVAESFEAPKAAGRAPTDPGAGHGR